MQPRAFPLRKLFHISTLNGRKKRTSNGHCVPRFAALFSFQAAAHRRNHFVFNSRDRDLITGDRDLIIHDRDLIDT